jgi:hypothetical protein
MGDRIEILMTNCGKVSKIDASIGGLGMTITAVDGYGMAARNKPRRNFFSEGLKSTVVRGDTTGAQQGNPHLLSYRRTAF